MTTTTVRKLSPVSQRDGEVMHERIEVAPCGDNGPPRLQDAMKVQVMRRIAAAKLRFFGLSALIDEVLLIVSELLTNAVLHSGAKQITLRLQVEEGFLLISVTDGMTGGAERKMIDDDAESGRGLVLVEALVAEHGGKWGTKDNGAETWCSLKVPTEAQS
ncbi:ATP-binding protein [Streptomyces sp. 4F14]|uniref:ATP-binding protein n=1 Tax=Streptomyces sp. 4F14 TaxID=3394380 RepID=UPI003A870833